MISGVKVNLTFGSLFAGIGGFDLGFERAGLLGKWQVENEPFATRVLAKHWSNVTRHGDVTTFPPAGEWYVDVICGGFPCQDISRLKQGAQGLKGVRSGLWSEYARIISELRPRFVVIENVPALATRGLNTVLRDLAAIGYDAEWNTFSAEQFGAPHLRKRLFVVANPVGKRRDEDEIFSRYDGEREREIEEDRARRFPGVGRPSAVYANRVRWCPDSELCRMVDGIPDRLDRYRGLGNAVVPAVAEWIGRRLIEVST